MKKLVLIISFLLSGVAFANPPGTFQPLLLASSSPATISFGSTAQDNTAQTTYTLTGLSIGTPSASRYVVAAVQVRAASVTIGTVTIGGINATAVKSQAMGSLGIVALYIANVPTGTTASVVIPLTGVGIRAQAATWVLNNLVNSGTAEATAGTTTNPLALGMTVSSGSVQVGADMDGGGGTTSTWTGSITQNFDTPISGGPNAAGGASGATATGAALTITCTIGSPNTPGGVSASFR